MGATGTRELEVLEQQSPCHLDLQRKRTPFATAMTDTEVKISPSMSSPTLSTCSDSPLSTPTSTGNFKEYFAEGVQSFFNCNMADSYAPTDRSQLSRRDPNLYAFLLRYLGDNTWSHSC